MKDDYKLDVLEKMKIQYGIDFEKFKLVRDWIGQVYEAAHGNIRYIAKVFRTEYINEAIQSSDVMTYLGENNFNVPGIFKTLQGIKYFVCKNQIVVLYEYIIGDDMDKASNLSSVGLLYGQMRKLMESYTEEVSNHEYEFFIKRYLDIMKKKNYQGIDKFFYLGNYLWEQVKDLPNGFIHGDFHAGNMFLSKDKIIVYDFDACAIASPVYDIATYCDASDYFDLSDANFDYSIIQTEKNMREFLKGYERYYTLTKEEKKSIYYFIAIRHFDIQATIIDSQGLDCVDEQFLDNQYIWLEKWLDRINALSLG